MNSVDFPYRTSRRFYIAIFVALAFIGIIRIQHVSAMDVMIGIVYLVVSILGLWVTFTNPRVVTIDLVSGIASFQPRPFINIPKLEPISIRDYSSIFMSGMSDTYTVILINHFGKEQRLVVEAPKSEAEKLCELVSKQFGLRYRGVI
jgi:hypothetical protein